MNEQLELFDNPSQDSPEEERAQTLEKKIEESKKILRLAADMSFKYYGEPLIICYSSGKDSDTLLHLAETTLKPHEFEVINSHTSVDYPEAVYHRNDVFKRLNEKGIKATVIYPRDKNGNHITMWNLILMRNRLPTRLARHCCAVLKETSTPNRLAAMGIRADESNGRKGRDVFGIRAEKKSEAHFYSYSHTEEVHREAQEIDDPNWDCTLIKTMKEHKDTIVSPLYYWSDEDVWDYIRQNNIEVCVLYEKLGLDRLGCIGCPMATYKQKMKQFAYYPTYRQAYVNACNKLLEQWKKKGKQTEWKTGEEMFNWWIQAYEHSVKGQLNLFDEEV